MADSIYKQVRKEHDFTRDEVCDKACDLNCPIQPERLERIEDGKFSITPDEVLLLSQIYGEPILCNHYCANECPIGKKYVPAIKEKDLTQIVLELLSSVNTLKKSQERLIEITADGEIDDGEIPDFVKIQNELEAISVTVETLQICVEDMLFDNEINMEKYNRIKQEEK